MRIEPKVVEMQSWASGLHDVYAPIAYQYILWAYWYLGFEEPDIKPGQPVINEAICKMTVACRLRLSEIGYEW